MRSIGYAEHSQAFCSCTRAKRCGWGWSFEAARSHLSQTQEMLTKIRSLIQEIHDIKQEKSNNIKTNLPEISQSCHKLQGTSDEGDLHGAYLKNSTPNHYCQSDNNDKTQCEEPPSPGTPAPTPDPPSLSHNTPPTPSKSSGVLMYPLCFCLRSTGLLVWVRPWGVGHRWWGMAPKLRHLWKEG